MLANAVILLLIALEGKFLSVNGDGAACDSKILNPNSCVIAKGNSFSKHVSFWLYRSSSDSPVKLDPSSISPTLFPQPRWVVILIHGFTGDRDYSPNLELRKVLLEKPNVSVISVEYGKLVPGDCYLAAVQNVPFVSKRLAQLINALVGNGIVDNDKIHVIGFSLGAQVAGQTANYVNKKLEHITGLDPAQPHFILASDNKKLDPSDANFVDVIHTDVASHGLLFTTGHLDFYFNFGKIVQPGCSAVSGFNFTVNCNHQRAVLYYAESINTDLQFWGKKCDSWVQLALGKCQGKAALAGYPAKKTDRGIYVVKTRSIPPFPTATRN